MLARTCSVLVPALVHRPVGQRVDSHSQSVGQTSCAIVVRKVKGENDGTKHILYNNTSDICPPVSYFDLPDGRVYNLLGLA